MHSETHEGKSKMTGNFVPMHAKKVHRVQRYTSTHSHFQGTAALSPGKEHPVPFE